MSRLKINFCWTNGVRSKEVFDHWRDGLWAAMKLIEKEHDVQYFEPDDDLPDADWSLLWEAPVTHDSQEDGHKYRKFVSGKGKKALLFAGGPIKEQWVRGFDHVFVESQINEDEFNAIGVKNSRAFGVNTDIFKPMVVPKTHTTVTHGACAGWKRQYLVCEAMGDKALVFGRFQEHDPYNFNRCRECQATVLDQQPYEEAAKLINSAHVSVNCAEYWGGGQRATLEAMACDIPVVFMDDSPKNREYIEESGVGVVCHPSAPAIREAVESLIPISGGRDYVLKKWTPEHYKNAILNAL